MTDAETPASDQSPAVSPARVLKAALPIVLVLVIAALAVQSYLPSAAQQNLETRELARLLGKPATAEKMTGWTDKDGDLIADSPADDKCVTPEKLVFSYVASDDDSDALAWESFLEALTEATGIPAEYNHFDKTDEQLEAMASGELHVTAFNTGAVPAAVNSAGFVPVSTFGHDGSFGYTMDLLVQADGPIEEIKDLKGKKITFVRPNSNSGFKAAFVWLMDERNMLPERDYDYGFSMSHQTSAQDVASGKTDAAPVASDLFERDAAAGLIDASKVRVLYQSEIFPPVALGYAHNLDPAVREAARKLLLEYQWQGTPLVDKYGTAERDEFVAVDYKNDWANVRRIDDVIEKARQNVK